MSESKHFPSTNWSLVDRVADGEESASDPLAQLLVMYFEPLKAHLRRKRLCREDDIDDIIQSFIAHKVLERDLISKADRDKGKFRTFLATSLERYAISEIRKSRSHKRHPIDGCKVQYDLNTNIPANQATSDSFDRAWARQVINQALERMKEECQSSNNEPLWGVFKDRVLRESLEGKEAIPYDQIIAKYKFSSYSQATRALHRAKHIYIKHLKHIVGQYISDPEQIDAEINDLKNIISDTPEN